MKVLVPSAVPLGQLDVPEDTQVVVYDVKQTIPEEHVDADVLAAMNFGGKRLKDAAHRLHNLRLVQGFMAGTESLENAGFAPDVKIASGVGLHDVTVAEHTMMLTLALVRRLPQLLAAQAESRWASDLGGLQELHPVDSPVTTLLEANVLVWGFGSIGQHLAGLLQPFGPHIRGVARSAGERAGIEVVTQDQFPDVLPTTDVLIMILPSTDETSKALGAEQLAMLPRHAYVVNVGRGSTVDEAALLDALTEGELAGAALDVTTVEPLPADSPLWKAPNIIISPHAAGGRPVNPEALLSRNIRALIDGGELTNLVER